MICCPESPVVLLWEVYDDRARVFVREVVCEACREHYLERRRPESRVSDVGRLRLRQPRLPLAER
jgi:hypothetical protein